MIPAFALARPDRLEAAFEAFERAAGDAAWYAGGTELLQVMKMGLARFGTLVDLKRLPELRGISVGADGTLTIGAATTHREIERSPVVREALPALVRLEAHVANVRVRNQGTLGGNLCFAEPHSDPATLLLACAARLHLAGARGGRELGVDEFLLEPFVTAREADEILVGVAIPPAAVGEGRAYEKAKFRERPAVSVAVRLRVADGVITDASVAVGSLTDIPVRVDEAANALRGSAADPDGVEDALASAAAAMTGLDAIGDLDGSPDYKRHLAGVLVRRATTAALSEALGRG